jgi:hypothetical protein
MSTAKGLHSSRLHPQFAVALAIAFAIIAFVAQPLTAASGVAPLTLVKQLVAQVLSIVKDKQMAQPDKQKKLRELGAAKFDFNEMSRLAMGKSWRSLSADPAPTVRPCLYLVSRRRLPQQAPELLGPGDPDHQGSRDRQGLRAGERTYRATRL